MRQFQWSAIPGEPVVVVAPLSKRGDLSTGGSESYQHAGIVCELDQHGHEGPQAVAMAELIAMAPNMRRQLANAKRLLDAGDAAGAMAAIKKGLAVQLA